MSLRADRMGDLSAVPGVRRPRGARALPAGRDGRGAARASLEGPARAAGLRLEPGLVDLLVREVRDEPGALPLLSHALRQTWERREGRTLTVEGYRRTGGIRDAVAQSAEPLYEHLDARGARPAARACSCAWSRPTSDGEPVRARVPRRPVVARRVARRAGRVAGRGPAAEQRRGRRSRSPTRRWRGSGRGCATGWRTTSGPTHPAPPRRRGRRLGLAGPARERALPRRTPGGRARMGAGAGPRADRGRARLPARLPGARRAGGVQRPLPAAHAASGQSPPPQRPGRRGGAARRRVGGRGRGPARVATGGPEGGRGEPGRHRGRGQPGGVAVDPGARPLDGAPAGRGVAPGGRHPRDPQPAARRPEPRADPRPPPRAHRPRRHLRQPRRLDVRRQQPERGPQPGGRRHREGARPARWPLRRGGVRLRPGARRQHGVDPRARGGPPPDQAAGRRHARPAAGPARRPARRLPGQLRAPCLSRRSVAGGRVRPLRLREGRGHRAPYRRPGTSAARPDPCST